MDNDPSSIDDVVDCKQTDAGYYALAGSPEQTECAPGYYCDAGSPSPYQHKCPAGTYRTEEGADSQADCPFCPAGYYCPLATVNPIICPQGFYCLLIVSVDPLMADDGEPTKCPKGTYGSRRQVELESDCTPCPEAYYCSQPGLEAPDGLCDPGYYCSHEVDYAYGASVSAPTDEVTGDICPAGGYCEMGTIVQKSCPPGTYNPNEGGKDEEACIPCLPGSYCSGEENATPTGFCDPGYYCPIGSKTKTEYPATPGHYTHEGAEVEEECENKYYNIYYAQEDCFPCPEGFVCSGPHNDGDNTGFPDTLFLDCPVGHYCEGLNSEPTPCPKGTFNPDLNSVSDASCRKCIDGHYCSEMGLEMPGDGLADTNPLCLPGYYCRESAEASNPDSIDLVSNRWGPCTTGHYCPEGSTFPIACPPGTYNPDVKSSVEADACLPCTAGYYCGTSGLSAEEGPCDEGYYCVLGSKTPRPQNDYCDVAEYCPEGSAIPSSCIAGTYQDNTHQKECKKCPIGYYCEDSTSDFTLTPCPIGHICTEGTRSANESPCPIGTFNPDVKRFADAHCLPCTPGYYCGTTGLSAVTDVCDEGYYCRLGAASKTPPGVGGPDGQGGRCTIGK